jgi:predicted HTH domain antitoxin
MSTTITIELPEELVLDLGLPAATLSERAKEWLALELFREGHMSSGSAASWLGMGRVDFIDLLGRRGVPYIDYPPEDLSRELAAVREAVAESESH